MFNEITLKGVLMMQMDIPTSEYINGKTAEKLMVNEMLRFNRLTLTNAVKKHNELYPDSSFSVQNVSNKISRNSLKLHDFAALAEACGFKLTLINTNDDFKIPIVVPPKRKTAKIVMKTQNFNQLLDEGYCEARSINFKSVIIVGEKCNDAAVWLEEQLTDNLTVAGEIKLYIECIKLFDVGVKPLTENQSE